MAPYGRLDSLILYICIIFMFLTLAKPQQQFSKVEFYEKWITYYERHVRSKTKFFFFWLAILKTTSGMIIYIYII